MYSVEAYSGSKMKHDGKWKISVLFQRSAFKKCFIYLLNTNDEEFQTNAAWYKSYHSIIHFINFCWVDDDLKNVFPISSRYLDATPRRNSYV